MTVTVQNTLQDATGQPVANAVVKITLVTSTTTRLPGYLTASDIIGVVTTTTDATGHWSAMLTPNDQITPANSYYQVNESGYTSTIVVPDGAGPYSLSSIIVTPPTPTPPGITGVQVAANGVVAGNRPEINLIPGTNMGLTAVDNPASNRVDVTLTSAGGSGGGGTPSATVVSETAYGQASNAGAAVTYSRGDHTHGSPALTAVVPAAETIGAAGSVGTAATPARADHVHAMPGSAVASNSAVGATASAGAAATVALSDHVHGRESFGSATAQTTYGQAAGDGTATTVSHSDHTHGTPALPTTGQIGAAPAASPTLTGTATVNGRLVMAPVSLGNAGASLTIDASTGNYFEVTANTASWTLANPTNLVDGQRLMLAITQDGTGGRVVTFGTVFHFGATIGTPVLSTAAGARDYLGFIYNAAAGHLDCIAYALGY